MLSFCIFILVTTSKGNTFWVFKTSNFNKDECIFTYGIRKIKARSWDTLMRERKKHSWSKLWSCHSLMLTIFKER